MRAYAAKRGGVVNAEEFFYHYSANGWKIGDNMIKDWKAALCGWEMSPKRAGRAAAVKSDSAAKIERESQERARAAEYARVQAHAITHGEYRRLVEQHKATGDYEQWVEQIKRKYKLEI